MHVSHPAGVPQRFERTMHLFLVACSFVQLACSGSSNSSGRTVHVAFIAQDVTLTVQYLAQARLVGLEAAILASPSLSADISTVVSHVYATADVSSPSVLFNDNIVHVTYADGLNPAIPRLAPNISFTIFEQPVASLVDKPNVEFLLIPVEAAGFQAGLLAGGVSTQKVVAVVYGHLFPNVLDGVREGLRRVCPLCAMVTLDVCSGAYDCPGQTERLFALAADADVVVVAMHGSNFVPRRIFAYNRLNATALRRPKKFVISIGNYLSDVATDVLQDPYHLGMLSLSMPSMLTGVVAALQGTFANALSTVPVSWSRNFTNGTRNAGVSVSAIAEFLVVHQLFLWGAYSPTYDGVVMATDDADLIGGLPFIPLGLSVSGLLPRTVAIANNGDETDAQLLPNISMHNVCALGDRVLMLSSDLTTLTILSTARSQVNVLTVQLPVAAYADAAQNATPSLLGVYNASQRVGDDVTWRVGMQCSELGPDGNAVLLSGGNAINRDTLTPTGRTLREVLRIRFVCPDPYNVMCDFFVLDNITSDVLASTNHRTAGQWDAAGEGSSYGVFASPYSSTSSSAAAAALSSLDNEWAYAMSVYTPDVRAAGYANLSIVNTTTFQTLAVAELLPPQGMDPGAFEPKMGTWVAALQVLMALDKSSNVIVSLRDPLLRFAPPIATTATTVLQWETVTEPLPAGTTPLCFFYNAAAERIVAVVAGVPSTAPVVTVGDASSSATTASATIYHYSAVLRRWVYQAALSGAVDAEYRCLPLHNTVDDTSDAGGSSTLATALLYPMRTRNLHHLVLVKYPLLVPDCDPSKGQVLSQSHATCVQCGAHEAASADGFCIDAGLTSPVAPWVWVVIGLAVGLAVVAFVAVGGVHLYRVRFSAVAQRTMWSQRALDATNAPPSGPCAILSLVIADADYLWSHGDDNEAASPTLTIAKHAVGTNNNSEDEVSSNNNREVKKKKQKNTLPRKKPTMHVVVDRLHDVLCRSVVANRCFMPVFRGDHAVVVCSEPAHLLCVAVEAALAMAHSDPPVQLSCGLHVGELLRTVDGALNRYVYAGTSASLTTRIALLPKTTPGAIAVSDTFLAAVGDTAVKSLGIVRGDSRVVHMDGVTEGVRELVVSYVADVFGKNAFDVAHQRRRKLLQRKRQTSAVVVVETEALKEQAQQQQPTAPQQQPNRIADHRDQQPQQRHVVPSSEEEVRPQEEQQQQEQEPAEQVVVPSTLHPFIACGSIASPLSPFASGNPLMPPPHDEDQYDRAGGGEEATASRGDDASSLPVVVNVDASRSIRPTAAPPEAPVPDQQQQTPQPVAGASPSLLTAKLDLVLSGSHVMPRGSTVTPLSRTPLTDSENNEHEVLIGLATSIGRILLAQLPESSARGAEATALIVDGLHLPNFKPNRDGVFPRILPQATLRFLAHRLVSICYSDIFDLLHRGAGKSMGRVDIATTASFGGSNRSGRASFVSAHGARRTASFVGQRATDVVGASCLETPSSVCEAATMQRGAQLYPSRTEGGGGGGEGLPHHNGVAQQRSGSFGSTSTSGGGGGMNEQRPARSAMRTSPSTRRRLMPATARPSTAQQPCITVPPVNAGAQLASPSNSQAEDVFSTYRSHDTSGGSFVVSGLRSNTKGGGTAPGTVPSPSHSMDGLVAEDAPSNRAHAVVAD